MHTRLSILDSGLQVYDCANGPRIYVSTNRRRPLFDIVHNTINHTAYNLIHSEISKSYVWPTMQKDCCKWYAEYMRCNLLKAKRNITHV